MTPPSQNARGGYLLCGGYSAHPQADQIFCDPSPTQFHPAEAPCCGTRLLQLLRRLRARPMKKVSLHTVAERVSVYMVAGRPRHGTALT